MLHNIYNILTINQIHNNFSQIKFYIEKVTTIIIKKIEHRSLPSNTEVLALSHRCLNTASSEGSLNLMWL